MDAVAVAMGLVQVLLVPVPPLLITNNNHMHKKIRVGIIFGGKSAEHDVSLQSAQNVIEALDKEKYEPVLIGITRQGSWILNDQSKMLLAAKDKPKAKS